MSANELTAAVLIGVVAYAVILIIIAAINLLAMVLTLWGV